MDNKASIEKLTLLEEKVELLLKEYQALKKDWVQRVEENSELKKDVLRLNEEIKSFQNQDKISKLVSSVKDDSQSASEMKFKINEYIKEIDKCIAHLNE
jgi:regulator of replication initiation timing